MGAPGAPAPLTASTQPAPFTAARDAASATLPSARGPSCTTVGPGGGGASFTRKPVLELKSRAPPASERRVPLPMRTPTARSGAPAMARLPPPPPRTSGAQSHTKSSALLASAACAKEALKAHAVAADAAAALPAPLMNAVVVPPSTAAPLSAMAPQRLPLPLRVALRLAERNGTPLSKKSPSARFASVQAAPPPAAQVEMVSAPNPVTFALPSASSSVASAGPARLAQAPA